MINNEWLDKYSDDMVKGARNSNFCSYLIALEAWRRGLDVTWYSKKVKRKTHAPGRLYSISSKDRTHEFYKAKGDKVNKESLRITGNKEKTKEVLERHNVRVPKGRRFFKESTDKEIVNYVQEIGFPVVLKPTKGFQGNGVITNITNLEFLKDSIMHVREELGYHDVMIEEHIEGEEYRVFVIEDEVIAVLNRIPANIVGDGVNTIRDLIAEKNNERRKNPRFYSSLIHIDFEIEQFLKDSDLTLDSVPKKGDQVFLRTISNISRGGDSIEVRDTFPPEVKRVAVNALKSFKEIPHAGVDIIIDKNQPIDKAGTVLEINGIPQIASLIYPLEGPARDIPEALIDYYFPESINDKNQNNNLYFDFREVLRPLRSKVASEVKLVGAPNDIAASKMYVIKGKVQNVGYRNWIRRQAIQADLHGYAQNRSNGDVHVVVSGSKENIFNFMEICKKGPRKARVDEVLEKSWDKSIKVGFEIKKSQKRKTKTKTKKKPLTLSQKLKRKLKRMTS